MQFPHTPEGNCGGANGGADGDGGGSSSMNGGGGGAGGGGGGGGAGAGVPTLYSWLSDDVCGSR